MEHPLTHRLGCQIRVTSSRVTYAELSDAEMGFGGFAVKDQGKGGLGIVSEEFRPFVRNIWKEN